MYLQQAAELPGVKVEVHPWKHEEDKEIVDGLEDIRVMIHNIIKSLDVSVPRAPVHLPNS